MANKIIERLLTDEEVVLLDVSETTAEENSVGAGKVFTDVNGVVRVGTALVGENVIKEVIPKVEACRFRVIPNKKEFLEMYNGEVTPVNYDSIYPIVKVGSEYLSTVAYGQLLPEFRDSVNNYPVPVYDSWNKGWVVGSIPFRELGEEEISSLGATQREFVVFQEVLKAIQNRYSRFVFASQFAYYSTVFKNGKVLWSLDKATANGVEVDTTKVENGYVWTFNSEHSKTLLDRVYNLIIKQVRLLLPKMEYEMRKFFVKCGVFSEGEVGNISNLISAMTQLRSSNHIDTRTLMTNANTPEVITGKTPQQILQTYMSSLFQTSTNREDEYTKAYEHFEDMFDEMIGTVAFACLIPN